MRRHGQARYLRRDTWMGGAAAGGGTSQAPTYTQVNFNASDPDYLTKASSGLPVTKELLYVARIQREVNNDEKMLFSSAPTAAQHFIRLATILSVPNTIDIVFRDAANVVVASDSSDIAFPTELTTLYMAINTNSGSETFQLYFDDTDVSGNAFVTTDADINLNAAGPWSLFALNDGTIPFGGNVAFVYWTNEYLDISLQQNRNLFQKRHMGADGSGPTGNQPSYYLTGRAADWNAGGGINLGFNGPYTMTGAVTDVT